MDISNLPTDNLYSFLSIVGVVLLVFSVIYPNNRLNIMVLDGIKLKGEMSLISLKINSLKSSVKNLKSDTSGLRDSIERKYGDQFDDLEEKVDIKELQTSLNDIKYREYLKFIYDYEDYIFPEKKLSKELQQKQIEIENNLAEIEILTEELNIKQQLFKRKLDQEKNMLKIEICGFILGSILLFVGLVNWYQKIQSQNDEKSKMEIQIMREAIKDSEKSIQIKNNNGA